MLWGRSWTQCYPTIRLEEWCLEFGMLTTEAREVLRFIVVFEVMLPTDEERFSNCFDELDRSGGFYNNVNK